MLLSLFTYLGFGRFAKAASIIFPILLVLGALWFLRSDAYKDGQRAERAKWELQVEKQRTEAQRLQREADRLRLAAEQFERERIARNRQEVEDAVRDIADQTTTPRQRARACLELRRQGQSSPACGPDPAQKHSPTR